MRRNWWDRGEWAPWLQSSLIQIEEVRSLVYLFLSALRGFFGAKGGCMGSLRMGYRKGILRVCIAHSDGSLSSVGCDC